MFLCKQIFSFLLQPQNFSGSIFFFSESINISSVVFDYNIWCIVIASSSSISAGYIINNFFDTEKDLINRPLKTILEKEISGKTKLRGYIILNLICWPERLKHKKAVISIRNNLIVYQNNLMKVNKRRTKM